MSEYPVYVFESSRKRNESPRKRRKVDLEYEDQSLELRRKTFQHLWPVKHERIQVRGEFGEHQTHADIQCKHALQVASSGLEREILQWSQKVLTSQVAAGIVAIGHGASFTDLFHDSLSAQLRQHNRILVTLDASECSNLKALLRSLIQKATQLSSTDDEDTELLESVTPRGPKLLNYDLQILHDWCYQRNVDRVIVVFRDAEAFDASVISEASLVFKSWLDRVQTMMIFGIGTSIDLFQARLSISAIEAMEGQVFETKNRQHLVNDVLLQVLSQDSDFWLGSSVLEMLSQRQADCVPNTDFYISSIKYAYMSHCYGNALTSLHLTLDESFSDPKILANAIRHTTSFRKHVESMLDDKNYDAARALLDDDIALLKEAKQYLIGAKEVLRWIVAAVEILVKIHQTTKGDRFLDAAVLYAAAMDGNLLASSMMRELLLAVRRAPADQQQVLQSYTFEKLITMPPRDIDVSPDEFADMYQQLQALMERSEMTGRPLQGEHELQQETMRTTIIAQRVELTKQQSNLSKEDMEYADLVNRFHDELLRFFEIVLQDPKDLFLYEIVVYDLRSPIRDAFEPKPRFAVERALSSPHDYLACQCCMSEKGLTSTQAPTAILYQLYLETGSLLNVADLMSAFKTIMSDRYDDQVTSSLFSRALAELRYLGMIKPSRKKVDHIAKVMWKGL